MRTFLVVSLFALGCATAALAQSATAPSTAPASGPAPSTAPPTSTRGGDIGRDEYIQKAVDRAKRAAEKRFDQMDANHDGVLSAEERRTYRAERRAARSQ